MTAPEFHDGRKVDPSEWGGPMQSCDMCGVDVDGYGYIQGDGFLPDGSPCPDCPRGQELAEQDDRLLDRYDIQHSRRADDR